MFRNNLVGALSGIQEMALVIADHVNQHVQQVKLRLNTLELEQEVHGLEVSLGKEIYSSSDRTLATLNFEPAIERLIKRIPMLQKRLEANNTVLGPYEALHDFERLLICSDFTIQQVVIADNYCGLGESIKNLALPSQMLIFFIKKKSGIILAYGKVIIEAQDEVTFLCSKEQVKRCISFWT